MSDHLLVSQREDDQYIEKLKAERDALARRVAELEAALRKIEEWSPPRQLDVRTGRMESYGALLGSNGERDYFRTIAHNALASSGGTGAGPRLVDWRKCLDCEREWPVPMETSHMRCPQCYYGLGVAEGRRAGLRDIVERAVQGANVTRSNIHRLLRTAIVEYCDELVGYAKGERTSVTPAEIADRVLDRVWSVLAGERATRDEGGGGATVAGASRGRAAAASGTPLNDPGNPPLGASPNTSTGCGERSSSPSPSREQAGRAEQDRCVSIVEYSINDKQLREKVVARIREGHAQHLNAGRADSSGGASDIERARVWLEKQVGRVMLDVKRPVTVTMLSSTLEGHASSLATEFAAIRREAIEEAARECDACPDQHWGPWCAAKVRALAGDAPAERV